MPVACVSQAAARREKNARSSPVAGEFSPAVPRRDGAGAYTARWYDKRQHRCKGVDLPHEIRPGADKLFNLVRVSRRFAPIAGSCHDAVSNFSNGPCRLPSPA